VTSRNGTPLSLAVSRAATALYLIARLVAATALIAELVVVLFTITERSLFDRSILWNDEASRLALSIVTFIGGAASYRGAHHNSIRLITDRLSPSRSQVIAIGIEWLVLSVTAVAAWQSLGLLETSWADLTPILQISTGWIALPITVGMGLVALFALERLLDAYPIRSVLCVGAVVGILIAAAYMYGASAIFANNPNLSLVGMMVIFFVAILFGMPVSFGMLLAAISYLDLVGSAPLVAVPQSMVDGTGNFVLLALPFFIFAGLIMERGGISRRLVRFAMALIGKMKGGLLQVIVVTIYLVAGVSGSKIADVSAVGPVIRAELKRQGYREAEGAAALAASAAMSETIPPSIAMLVLGSVTPISIGALFVAGLIPAAVIAVCLMTLIYIIARRRSPCVADPSLMSPLKAAPGAILPLIMPLAMVVSIKTGIATPTEASSLAVVYGIVLSAIVYRALSPLQMLNLALECASVAGMVLFVLASASSFAWVLTAANLPQELIALLSGPHQSRLIFMAGSVALLIIIGSLLEGLPALIILAPLLLPIAVGMGIDAVQYGIVLILAMGVGAFIPPIGIGFYVSASVVGSDLESAARVMVPYAAVLVLGVLLIAFVPAITLAVPALFQAH
jgi:tripartite ATP-independent transporter DctM subunit